MRRRCGFALFALLLAAASVSAETLRIAADVWPPFTDASLPGNGLATELVSTALKRAGHRPEYVQVPWARALRGLEVGDYDLIISAWYSDERARFGQFSKPYLTNRVLFLKRKGSDVLLQSPADLARYSIAVVRGYSYLPAFDADTRLSKVPVMGFQMGARMLAAGRVQLTLEDELVARFYLNRELQDIRDQLEFLPQPLSENGLHILVRRSHPRHAELVEDFDRAMQAMREDGTYQAIFAKHGLSVPGS
ncbi:ABC transporter substrate-binding protein [Metapseudomonas resinovorans]|uniref:Putative ABC transporter substrate-binding protein n=1 Tax=Metapseudomonas resinovorans NBRC 106553 TaxID=1245471 RepID=S6AQL7_METRE|nr:transporter substrate-binding domain-containing protein [Pseudomonas resinovorans]BAN46121.1 putative ABC transporter substrate-binding protein [Pseudomonas resinovorans NBRC 106553]